MIQTIFFDAAGTLFELTETVGWHYALVARRLGLPLEAAALDRAFARVWKTMPPRAATGRPRADDDQGWWRELVRQVLAEVAPALRERDADAFFEVAYAHFAEAGVWRLFPEVLEVLELLRPRFALAVISNFDGRLRLILEQLGLAPFFAPVVISSEVGADKPDALIYRRALELSGSAAAAALHVGDDPVRDWQGAAAAGLHVFQLARPGKSLRDLLARGELVP